MDTLIIKMEPELKEMLRFYAEANHTTMSHAARIIIRRTVDPDFAQSHDDLLSGAQTTP